MKRTTRIPGVLILAVIFLAVSGMTAVAWGATPRVEAGGNYSLTLRADGSLWSWGENTFGQLGDGTVISRNSPVRIGADTTWTAVAAGFYHTVALKADGSLWTWGDNTKGQLGDASAGFSRSAPARVGTESTWAAVAAGDFHTLALKTDGTLWAWGDNTSGQVGDGSVVPTLQPVPKRIGADSDWAVIAAGGSHSAALKTNGTLWAWGANNAGQLGNGAIVDAVAPVQVVLPAPFVNTDWTAVAAGRVHAVGVKTGGTLQAWGSNIFGQLGNGTVVNSAVPVQEAGNAATWVAATAGDAHSVARRSDGTLWSWGGNLDGQLGIGTNVDAPTPTRVGTDSDWADVSAGSAHTVALKTGGTVWSWGNNSFGQLGDATTVARNAPALVAQARFLPRGDLDQNASVDIADALKALRIAVGLIQPTADDLIIGDVAPQPVPDGVIDIADALLILRQVVGLVTL